MRRLLSYFILLPAGLMMISFALSNRDNVILYLWPIPYSLEVPIYLCAFLFFMLGLILAFISSSLRISKLQSSEKLAKKKLQKLEKLQNQS